MDHPQIARAEINGVPFTLYYDYDQLKDGKLKRLSDDEKIEWFRLRMRFVFLEPLSRLYRGKTTAYRELNSLALDDLPARSFVVPAFSMLLNGVEALGSFITPPGSGKRANFNAFIETYMKAWDRQVPGSPYPTRDLKEILWKHFRNGIAHGFCISGGGIDNEADPTRFRVVNGRLQVGPNAFFDDFAEGVRAFFGEAGTVHRVNFLKRFKIVYPTDHAQPRPLVG